MQLGTGGVEWAKQRKREEDRVLIWVWQSSSYSTKSSREKGRIENGTKLEHRKIQEKEREAERLWENNKERDSDCERKEGRERVEWFPDWLAVSSVLWSARSDGSSGDLESNTAFCWWSSSVWLPPIDLYQPTQCQDKLFSASLTANGSSTSESHYNPKRELKEHWMQAAQRQPAAMRGRSSITKSMDAFVCACVCVCLCVHVCVCVFLCRCAWLGRLLPSGKTNVLYELLYNWVLIEYLLFITGLTVIKLFS